MPQIITTDVATPVTVQDDTIIVAEGGSISSAGAGPALTVNGRSAVTIDGGLYAANDSALVTNGGYYGPVIIGHSGVLVSTGVAGTITVSHNAEADFVNEGRILTQGNGMAFNTTNFVAFLNFGEVNANNVAAIFNTNNVYLENNKDGFIYGYQEGVVSGGNPISMQVLNEGTIASGNGYAISIKGTLNLNNKGVLTGGVSATSETGPTSKGLAGSSIVNEGDMTAGSDGKAIQLGAAADLVKNKTGTIDGEVHLGGGNDKFAGGSGDETVFGGTGKDVIKSKGGNDRIDSGAGKDTVTLGKGQQTFVHNAGDGKDKLFKFKPGKDRIDLSDYSFNGFSDLKSAMTEKGNKVVLDLPGPDKLVLKGVELVDLSSGDFVL